MGLFVDTFKKKRKASKYCLKNFTGFD